MIYTYSVKEIYLVNSANPKTFFTCKGNTHSTVNSCCTCKRPGYSESKKERDTRTYFNTFMILQKLILKNMLEIQ